MAFTKEQLCKLKEAYATGTFRVRYGDHDVTYKSEAEMRKIIERMERELGQTPKANLTQFTYRKGLRERS